MGYEDLKQLYAAAAKERDELKKELEHVKRLYEMAKAERDVLIKRMIELEEENVFALADFKASLLGDSCDFCANKFEDYGRCYESDIDCEKCRHDDCPCRDCRALDRWVWRGAKKEGSYGKA